MAYLNLALTNFRTEINQRWSNRDKASDGWIGNAAHQATKSDHNAESDGSVDAIDIDVDGIDVAAVLAAAIGHEATAYVIYNRQITSRNMSGGLGVWHPYTGSSPHTEHIHVSSRDSYERSTKPWFPIVREVTVMKDAILAREEDKPEVFIGNGIIRRHITNENQLLGVQYWIRERGGDPTVHLFKPGTIGVLGVLIS